MSNNKYRSNLNCCAASLFACLLSLSTLSQATPTKIDIELDSDRDGVSDHIETMYGFDPLQPYDVWRDLDQDHLPRIFEVMHHKDQQLKDNDVINNAQLLALSAIADLTGHLATDEQVIQALSLNQTPIDLYRNLLDVDRLSRMAFIGQAYQTILNRNPDRDGARYYYHQLSNHMTKAQMIGQMLGSQEYDSFHQQMDDHTFVNWLVSDLAIYQSTKLADQYLSLIEHNKLNREQLIFAHIEQQSAAKPEKNRVFNGLQAIKVLSILLNDTLPTESQQGQLMAALDRQDTDLIVQSLLLNDRFLNQRVKDAPPSMGDIDQDGRPNGIEFLLGHDPHTKDNPVLNDDSLFVRQVFLDGFNQVLTQSQLDVQLKQLQKVGGKSQWLAQLLPNNIKANEQQQWLHQTLLNQPLTQHHQQNVTAFIDQILQSQDYQARFY